MLTTLLIKVFVPNPEQPDDPHSRLAYGMLCGLITLAVNILLFGFKLAIGSSSKNAGYILERLGLTDLFPVVADGTKITNSKPHPEVFLLAADMIANHFLPVPLPVGVVTAAVGAPYFLLLLYRSNVR